MGTEKLEEGCARSGGEKRKVRGRPTFSDEQLIAGVKAFAKKRRGRAFTMEQFDSWAGRPFCSMTVTSRLGRWREVLERVGVEGAARGEYSGEELLCEFERVWAKIGRRPGNWALTRHAKYSIDPYRRRWRSVRELGEMVEAMRAGEVSREEVVRADARRERARRRTRLCTRFEVLKRDGYRCVVCGRSPANERGVELEVDHIVPVCQGGGDGMDNLRTLCGECNGGKAGK